MMLKHFRTKNSGFTIIEVVVLLIIVLILAAVILPRFFDAENHTRQSTVEENMKIVQMAVRAYALNNNDTYPLKPDDPGFRSFFPGGNCSSQNPSGGNYPENPFTHMAEAPVQGNVVDVKQSKQLPGADLGGPRMAGKIFYNAIIPNGAKSAIGYAIEGADKNGSALIDPRSRKIYVLSNL
jgi:type II secretory pathway pseudopilin PulG